MSLYFDKAGLIIFLSFFFFSFILFFYWTGMLFDSAFGAVMAASLAWGSYVVLKILYLLSRK
ncbi:hypothetical protein [Criblamydia sequanensis]|uniref:Membrane protein n=1 Tax=Candidatus Criblamydia sequanensis CRIB-18 TaxID=1437425 RepID=A0A090CYN2_9BACT|nr:hypothetical protein [Criblamydia sequanensis]CDR33606.1 putative membrane protein [Criblamydia sequanensis CRIB-18]